MPTNVDLTWAVPVLCLVIAVIGVTWAKHLVRADERRYGPNPGKVIQPPADPSPHH